ncbi:hypothetical protein Pcinc_010388 [Petrolisthes cinctipes]|uniref:Uncharacterized protein n=1 Tax=Petrolisthes cinctipes TaxID=88211 RepID=A0AAE1G3F5_PETCI|nr:hypothetical protein Pcinc_010388 [Petrolisthes cinctipes]
MSETPLWLVEGSWASWQGRQDRTQFPASREILCQTNLCVSSHVVARHEGCESPWTKLKTWRRRDEGIQGCGHSVLTSQRMEMLESPRGTSFHCKAMIAVLNAVVSGSCCCSLARWL